MLTKNEGLGLIDGGFEEVDINEIEKTKEINKNKGDTKKFVRKFVPKKQNAGGDNNAEKGKLKRRMENIRRRLARTNSFGNGRKKNETREKRKKFWMRLVEIDKTKQ